MCMYDIRVLTDDDLSRLLRVRDDAGVHEERLSAQSEGRARYLGASADGRVVGFVLVIFGNKADVMAYTGNQPCMDMVDLYVDEFIRGMGVGSALIAAAEGICADKGVPFIGLDVNPKDNPRALELYKRLGYSVVGDIHLDGVYESRDEQGNASVYEDWCVDMIKRIE